MLRVDLGTGPVFQHFVWFVIVAGGVMFTLLAIRSQTEEQKLLERFGEPYRAYRASTARFLPKMLK